MSRPGFRLLVCLLLLLAAACGGSEGRDSEQRARGSAATFGDGYGGVEDEVHSSEPPLAVPADAPLLAVLGDSLAAGLHLPPSQAWPARICPCACKTRA